MRLQKQFRKSHQGNQSLEITVLQQAGLSLRSRREIRTRRSPMTYRSSSMHTAAHRTRLSLLTLIGRHTLRFLSYFSTTLTGLSWTVLPPIANIKPGQQRCRNHRLIFRHLILIFQTRNRKSKLEKLWLDDQMIALDRLKWLLTIRIRI